MSEGLFSVGQPTSAFGKHVGFASYFHRSALEALDETIVRRITEAELHSGCQTWNVVKLRRDRDQWVSLLTYEEFSAPFPTLLDSLSVNLATGRIVPRSYRSRINPPVLHRKELLLSPDDPRAPDYAALTSTLERLGLFSNPKEIGTRLAWQAQLEKAGVAIVDDKVVALDAPGDRAILRHRAAIQRDGLSTPIQALLRYDLINPARTVFDYGCGRGSDVEGLRRMGFQANGWDPYYAPTEPIHPADVVNLGFVLNVIERPLERVEALKAAFDLSRTCLAVGVILPNLARWVTGRPYLDGVVTRLGTFQKFYTSAELRTLIQSTLGHEPFQVSPGVMLVFKDAGTEQDFLSRRQHSRRPTQPWMSARREQRLTARRAALVEELEGIQDQALTLGRWPGQDELAPELADRISDARQTWPSVLRLAQTEEVAQAVDAAAEGRREDLAVYFALNLFNQRTAYRALPDRLQRDVRAFYGDHQSAVAAGHRLLFSMADLDQLRAAADHASSGSCGLVTDDAFWIGSRLVARLPGLLRCFIGCAERYYGDLAEMQVVKLHLRSAKLTALRFQDFDRSPLPRLVTRVKIDLRRQRIDEFDHAAEDQRLLLKSSLMAPDEPGYDRQRRFDQAIAAAGIDTSDLRAVGGAIREKLAANGLAIDGWRITPIN